MQGTIYLRSHLICLIIEKEALMSLHVYKYHFHCSCIMTIITITPPAATTIKTLGSVYIDLL